MRDMHDLASVVVVESPVQEIHAWLRSFSRAVREVDYATGRSMFAEDVVSFGSINEMLDGLDELESRQWRNVWGVTRGFEFDYSSIRICADGDQAWAVALWSSQGRNHKGWFNRQGRSTFIFERRDGRWVAVHTHFSLVPPSSI